MKNDWSAIRPGCNERGARKSVSLLKDGDILRPSDALQAGTLALQSF